MGMVQIFSLKLQSEEQLKTQKRKPNRAPPFCAPSRGSNPTGSQFKGRQKARLSPRLDRLLKAVCDFQQCGFTPCPAEE
jgi:hypothetical protein